MFRAMGLFSSPQQQYVPPIPSAPPPPPSIVDKDVVDAAQRTKTQLAASGGYGGTNTTGGQGVTDPAKVQGKTLLGS